MPYRSKINFDRVTNIAVVVAAIVLLLSFARSYFSDPPATFSPEPIKKGSILHEIAGLEFDKSSRTLILALSTTCRYCTQNLPFYKNLAKQIEDGGSSSTRLIALFPESRERVDAYTSVHNLSVSVVTDVNYPELEIPFTPSLILIDSNGEVLHSWDGTLSEDEQKDVHSAISEAMSSLISAPQPNHETKQTVSLFDETKPLGDVRPTSALLSKEPKDLKLSSAVRRQINYFDVDRQGSIYVGLWHKIIKYSAAGSPVWSIDAPEGFQGPFCVDDDERVYVPTKMGIWVHVGAEAGRLAVPISKLPYSAQAVIVKMSYDKLHKRIYVQAYEPTAVAQTLFRVNPINGESQTIHKQQDPVRFTAAYAPGAFDFALGPDHLFISDIHQYRIDIYSRRTGQHLKRFSKFVTPQPIDEKDGVLINRKMTVGNLTAAGSLKNYSPIIHLGFTNHGYLAVWTSSRDAQLRQQIDVYDSEMNLIGVDYKYAHPTISNYVFANNKVYVPDFGFGRTFNIERVSPLDVPSKALGVKIFDDSFHRI